MGKSEFVEQRSKDPTFLEKFVRPVVQMWVESFGLPPVEWNDIPHEEKVQLGYTVDDMVDALTEEAKRRESSFFKKGS